MERIALVELDIERCSLTYGAGACTAAIGVTGDDKCFNCLATCQDKDNYTEETVTATYSYASGDLPRNIDTIPNIKDISLRPAKLELGESIGIRANVTINFMDSRSPDTGAEGDRYLADRDYDPYTRGTYWGKFRARYPFTKGSNIRILRGTNDQSKEQMEVRHFIVDKMAGPNSNGSFTIVCKDALKLADSKQAKAPKLSTGVVKTTISAGATSLVLDPTGIGSDYPSTGFVNIGGNEVCSYTRSGDTLTLVRARKNTEAEEHELGERVQWCLGFTGKKVSEIIRDLLVIYAKVPSEYIPFTDWESEDDTFIDRLYSATIAEPEGVTDLINELLQQTASCLWWDDSAKLLRFRVLRAVDSNAAKYNDDVIVAGSFSAVDQPDRRVSQVWTYYGQINPLEKLDEKQNYSNSLATVASEEEENYGEPSIKTIFSRWIARDNRDAAERLNLLILSRYSTPPRMISFGLQRDAYGSLTIPELGGGYQVNSWTMQDATGASYNVPVQAVQVRTTDTGHSVMAEEVLYSETIAPESPNIKNVYIDTSRNNYNLYSAASSIYTINEGDIINLEVGTGIEVGSASTDRPAFVFGSGWPANVSINIINNGNIIGRGGAGGNGGRVNSNGYLDLAGGEKGQDGGLALDITNIALLLSVSIENNGTIGGGGGGGGGGGAAEGEFGASGAVWISGSGGGGGAFPSIGGKAGINAYSSNLGQNGQGAASRAAGLGGEFVGIAAVRNGAGGNGGTIGQNGQAGQSGQSGDSVTQGGAGGLAGNAINKNGNTVTITNNGTIAGTIAP